MRGDLIASSYAEPDGAVLSEGTPSSRSKRGHVIGSRVLLSHVVISGATKDSPRMSTIAPGP